ncbi:uncharacterized protein [Danio rerio]|uniref:Glycosyl hydrolases family 22 (GH22) domain-containing protein n=1 Tax=Danio rerio TaxID=7955 RepID=A0A8M1RN62_DANRE|nr:vegetative cell wall protein gp1-like [Danio rerio]|eukprot:XP_003197783.1 vegetative cell wall protein gp1-like [Danio rerio]
MKSITPVKMLSACALILLAFSVTDGLIMTKCELKAKLDAAQFQQIMANGQKIPVNNLIARLVCMANSTAFNTSSVKVIALNSKQKRSAPNPAKPPAQGPAHAVAQNTSRDPPHNASEAPAHDSEAPPHNASKDPHHNASNAQPHNASKAPPRAPASKAPPRAPASKASPRAPASKAPPRAPASKAPPRAPASKAPPRAPESKAPPRAPASKAPPQGAHKAVIHDASKAPPSRVPPQVPTGRNPEGPTKAPHSYGNETQYPQPKAMERLYGVFQLSDQLACVSGMVPSLNICNMNCNALLDDDLTNDIACLKTLMNSMNAKVNPTSLKIANMLLAKECRSVVPSKIFANCA